MIRFDLICENQHDFEAWFSSNSDFDQQCSKGLVACPHCGSTSVEKALMAPAVSTSRRKEATTRLALNPTQAAAMDQLRKAVKTIRENSEDVGERFPAEARKIHYGESEERGIIGQANAEEVKALVDEGVAVAPLPELPEDKN
ncbi:MAG: DUF1178 family protein [Pseudomonadota bacterium]